MANRFKIRRGSVVPNNSADIENYELVYNYTDNELWTKHNGSVVKISSGTNGTVTNVVAGNGLTGGGTSTATLDLDFSQLTDMTGNISGTTEFILQNGTVESRKAASEIKLSAFNNDLSISSGTVTSVTAGTGATHSGTNTVNPTINVVGENGLVASANAIGLDLSTLAALQVNSLADEDLFVLEVAVGGAIKKIPASDLKTYINTGLPASAITSGTFATARIPNLAASKITSGTIPSARLDADTAHLSGTQTFSGAKTFSASMNLESELNFTGAGNKIIDVETLAGSNNFTIRHHNPSGNLFEDALKLTANAGAYIHYNGSSRLETTSSGAQVRGNGSMFTLLGTDHSYIQFFPDGSSAGRKAYIGQGSSSSDAFTIANESSDADIQIQVKDGTSTTTAILIDASDNARVRLPNDNQRLSIGEGNDIQITHDGTNSYIDNYKGHLTIKSNDADKDLILSCDNGSGGETAYLTLDGSATNLNFHNKALVAIGGIYGNSGTLNLYNNTYYFKNASSGIIMSLNGSTLDLPNTGDWSFIKNNTNSGGLRFGTKDSGGTYANQIEISNAGNYVKLNENTTVTGQLTATTTIHSNQGFTTDYGIRFNNGATDFMFYNNTNDNLFYLRDLTNAQMLQTWTTSTTTIHKNLIAGSGILQISGSSASEGGEIQFSPGTSGSYTTTFHLDSFQNKLRVHSGGAERFYISTDGTIGLNGTVAGTAVLDEDNMASNHASKLATQQSIKAYVDANSGSNTASDGSASAPAFNFTSDTNTGMFRVGSDTLGFSAGGNTKLQIKSDGRINYNGWTGVDHITVRSNGHTNSGSSSTFFIKFCTVVVDNSPTHYNGLSLSGKIYNGDNSHGNWIDWSVWFNNALDSAQIAHGGFMRSNGAHWISNILVQRTGGDGEIDNGTCTYELYYDINQNWANNFYNVATEVHYPNEGKFNVTWNHDQSEVTSLPGTQVVNMQTNYYDDGNQTLVQTGVPSAPSYSFLAQRNTGMYGFTDNTIGFSCNSTRMLSIKADGNLELRNDGSSQGASIQRVGGIQFTWDRDTYGTDNVHSIRSDSDNIIISSYDDVTINLDSNNNDSSETFDIRKHASSLTGGTLLYQVDGAGLCSSYGGYGSINGSASSPSFRFNNDADTGFYRRTTNQIGFSTAGEEQMYLADGSLHIAQPVRFQFANDQRIFDDGGGGFKVGAESHKLTLYAGTNDGTIQFQDGGRNGTVRATISGGGVYKWGSAAAHGQLTWDTGKAILSSMSGNTLELRSQNTTDMIAIETNQTRFIADGTERFRINGNGIDLSNNTATKIVHNNGGSRDKYRVWNSSYYAIGMDATFTFGGLSSYAMTFQMNTDAGRGWWWGDNGHSNAQGAMSLDNAGKLTVAHSARIGYGESDTTTPGASYKLDVSGNTHIDGNLWITSKIHTFSSGTGHVASMENNGTYLMMRNPEGNTCIFMGDSGDSNNYYDNGSHIFRALGGGSTYATLNSTGIIHTSSSAFTMGNIANKIRIQTDGVDDFSFLTTGNAYANTFASTVYAASKLETAGYTQVNSSGTLLRLYNSSWSNATTHDVILNGYGNILGDYVYLKTSGNSANTHGMLLSTDNYLFWGRDNLTTGAVDNSATAPMTDVCMRIDASGNALFDGDVVASSTLIASDARLKENVKDLNYGLKDVLSMRAVSFDWIDKRNGQHDIGVIAQEMEKIIPEVVVETDTLNSDEDTHKTVDYAKLTSVLITAIQEQQVQIDELKTKLGE